MSVTQQQLLKIKELELGFKQMEIRVEALEKLKAQQTQGSSQPLVFKELELGFKQMEVVLRGAINLIAQQDIEKQRVELRLEKERLEKIALEQERKANTTVTGSNSNSRPNDYHIRELTWYHRHSEWARRTAADAEVITRLTLELNRLRMESPASSSGPCARN